MCQPGAKPRLAVSCTGYPGAVPACKPDRSSGGWAMKSTICRLLLIAFVVCATADVALAGLFPGAFSFANSALNAVFLWPLRIGGC